MSQLKIFALGALLMAACFGVAQGLARPALALSGGPYLLMQHSNTTANVGVFRLDTSSGGVSYCYMTGSTSLSCTKEVE